MTSDKSSGTSLGKFTLKSEDQVEKPFAPGVLFKQKSKEQQQQSKNEQETKSSGPNAIREATKEYEKQLQALTKPKQHSTDSKKDEEVNKKSKENDHDERTSRKKSPTNVAENPKKKSPPPKKTASPPPKRKSPGPSTSTSTAPKPQLQKVKVKKFVDFDKLFDKVVFVLSGFENPYRAQIRDKAVQMGAQYKGDWGKGCTHLVCAFGNTPKYNQVKGKGKIVKKEWILDSFQQKKRLPWKK